MKNLFFLLFSVPILLTNQGLAMDMNLQASDLTPKEKLLSIPSDNEKLEPVETFTQKFCDAADVLDPDGLLQKTFNDITYKNELDDAERYKTANFVIKCMNTNPRFRTWCMELIVAFDTVGSRQAFLDFVNENEANITDKRFFSTVGIEKSQWEEAIKDPSSFIELKQDGSLKEKVDEKERLTENLKEIERNAARPHSWEIRYKNESLDDKNINMNWFLTNNNLVSGKLTGFTYIIGFSITESCGEYDGWGNWVWGKIRKASRNGNYVFNFIFTNLFHSEAEEKIWQQDKITSYRNEGLEIEVDNSVRNHPYDVYRKYGFKWNYNENLFNDWARSKLKKFLSIFVEKEDIPQEKADEFLKMTSENYKYLGNF